MQNRVWLENLAIRTLNLQRPFNGPHQLPVFFEFSASGRQVDRISTSASALRMLVLIPHTSPVKLTIAASRFRANARLRMKFSSSIVLMSRGYAATFYDEPLPKLE